MEESILISIKKLIGLEAAYTIFDEDIKIHINSAIASLCQMDVGPSNGFMITSESEKWSDFVGNDMMLNEVRSLVFLKVKLLFDPPTNSNLMESMKQMIKEYEWRLYVQKGQY